jgi:hypothetical protein
LCGEKVTQIGHKDVFSRGRCFVSRVFLFLLRFEEAKAEKKEHPYWEGKREEKRSRFVLVIICIQRR